MQRHCSSCCFQSLPFTLKLLSFIPQTKYFQGSFIPPPISPFVKFGWLNVQKDPCSQEYTVQNHAHKFAANNKQPN